MAKNMLKSKKAFVACNGGTNNHDCSLGCLGCSACMEACRMDALFYNDNHVATVDLDKCVGCGLCVKACPQSIIHLRLEADPFYVRCSGSLKGAEAKDACDASCIQCGLCAKNCPSEAITVDSKAAVINETMCLSCGNCVVVCPRNAVADARGIINK